MVAAGPAGGSPVTPPKGTPAAADDPGGLTALLADTAPPGTAPETDGRRMRRALNREAVVDALLDLYSEGNLRPGTDEIAERAGLSPRSLFRYFEDTDDLTNEAVARQQARALPLVPIDAGRDAPFEVRVRAVVDQRFRLFEAVGQAALVSRLRAPFQARLAHNLRRNREFLRGQLRSLFAPELAAMPEERAAAALAGADVLAGFESYRLLTDDQGYPADRAKEVLAEALRALLTPDGAR